MLIISPSAKISKLADIEDSQQGTRILIEDGVQIDSFVRIKASGGLGDVQIGRNSYINSGVVIYTGNGVKIGENVLIASNCTLAPTNHEFELRDRRIVDQRFQPSRGGILIEDDVWIGANCVILDGAIIRRGCVVGALSLVRNELDPYGIYYGSPAKKMGERK
jgi:acetyltransferase-like isoleucine patch superfamily enzyme